MRSCWGRMGKFLATHTLSLCSGVVLLDEKRRLTSIRINHNSVATDVHLFHGLPHGFRRYGKLLCESERWDRVMEEGIKWVLCKPEAGPWGGLQVKLE